MHGGGPLFCQNPRAASSSRLDGLKTEPAWRPSFSSSSYGGQPALAKASACQPKPWRRLVEGSSGVEPASEKVRRAKPTCVASSVVSAAP